MPERIEVVRVADGLVLRRFGLARQTGRTRLADIKDQLATLVRTDPALGKYRARDLAIRRADLYDDDVVVQDDDPDRPDPTRVGLTPAPRQ